MAEPVPVGAQYVRAVHDAGAFAMRVRDELVPILVLEPGVLASVSRACGVPWTALVETPTADLLGASMLLAAAEQHCGVDDVPAPTSVAELMARFVVMPARNGTGGDD